MDRKRHRSNPIDDGHPPTRQRGKPAGEARARRVEPKIRGQLPAELWIVGERMLDRGGVEEEVERIGIGDLRDEPDLDRHPPHRLGKIDACDTVLERVLHPIDEVGFGAHAERVRRHGGVRMRGRSQPEPMRRQRHGLRVALLDHMREGDAPAHDGIRRRSSVCGGVPSPRSSGGSWAASHAA